MENGDLQVRNRRHEVKTSPRMAHSSPPEEKKLGFPFSKNGPSAIQGEGATSPFSDLGEWEERGVTTPLSYDKACKRWCGFLLVMVSGPPTMTM
jgi:hypothetical protein